MKKTFPAAAILAIFLLNASCANNDDTSVVSTPELPKVILPLEVGNS
jgi:hypothetical protein